MEGRLIAIGDIHGCSTSLEVLVQLIQPRPCDTIVTLGDYVNRGPDSRGVLDQLIALREHCNLIALLGNHDDFLLANRPGRTAVRGMEPEGPNGFEMFDDHHFEFLQTCVLSHESDTHFFVHANYAPRLPMNAQSRHTLLWSHLHTCMPKPHRSKRIAVVGHTSQRDGTVLDLPHIKCIDTYCYGGGWLTGMDINTGKLWQVNKQGEPRSSTKNGTLTQ